jgi:hypothetical protein
MAGLGAESEALSNSLETVTLSNAKGLGVGNERFFAALRMTRYLFRRFLRSEENERVSFDRANLKKQSQFVGGRMNATVCVTGSYENNSALQLWENEPDQSQSPASGR